MYFNSYDDSFSNFFSQKINLKKVDINLTAKY